jgi:hypothetical protein
MVSTIWGICFSLKANPSGSNTKGFDTVLPRCDRARTITPRCVHRLTRSSSSLRSAITVSKAELQQRTFPACLGTRSESAQRGCPEGIPEGFRAWPNRTARFEGTVRVIVIENRHRRVPFPKDLFRGPFDQRWNWEEEWCGPQWIGDTLREIYEHEGVPFHML